MTAARPEQGRRPGGRRESLQGFLAKLIWICVLPMVLMAIYLTANHIHALLHQRDHEAEMQATRMARMVDRQLREHIAVLQIMASSPLLDDPPRLQEFYRAATSFRDIFGGDVILADTSSRMLINTRLPLGAELPKLPQPRGNAAAPQALATGRPAVGDMFMGPIANEPLVAVAVPVKRGERTQLLLLSTIPTRAIQQRLQEAALGTQWAVILLDGKDEVVARLAPAQSAGEGEDEAPARRFVAKSEVSPWSVALEIPDQVYHAPIVSTAAVLVAGILLVTLICLLGARYTARRLARAVASLAQPARQPGTGPAIVEIEAVRGLLEESAAARREAESNRQDSDQRFRQLFDSAPVPLCFVNAQGKLTAFNQRFQQLFGYTPQDVPDLDHWWRLAYPDPDYRRWVIRTWDGDVEKAAREDDDIAPREYRVTCKDGRVRTMAISGITLGDDLLAVFYDVSERKQAELELRQSQAAIHGLLDATADVVLLLDRDFRVLAANEMAARRFGTTASSLQGRPMADLLTGEVFKERQARLNEVLTTGAPARFQDERDGLHFDNRIYPVNDEKGAITGIAIYARDITQRVEDEKKRAALEKQLIQAQKMEAIGTLAGGIAHDFNNILGVIVGYSEMALDEARQGRPSPHDLDQVLQAAERAKNLVRQILTFSRKVEVEKRPLDLNREVGQAAQLLGKTLPKMIRIEIDLAPDLWSISANANQMEQILLNLCTNAADAMGEGGTLRITTANAVLQDFICHTCGKYVSGKHVSLKVSDDGKGMDPGTLEHIFEPFYTTKEQGKGTGLGLSTVHGIVTSHGGHIACQSSPGQGTAFILYFPALEVGAAEQDSAPAAGETPAGRERLLVADDEESLLRLCARLLKQAGYQVLTATSGEEAVLTYADGETRPDLVLMDLGMPGMGGRKALKAILELDPRAKVVIASGYAANQQVKDALDAGALGFVAKPYRRNDLLATLRRVLDGEEGGYVPSPSGTPPARG